jgi:GNAT superfamily N-acetyltransferase
MNALNSESVYLLARKYNKTIGSVSLFWSWSYKPYPGRQAILSDLYVSPNARDLGIAGLLIQACEEQARQCKNIHSIIWR